MRQNREAGQTVGNESKSKRHHAIISEEEEKEVVKRSWYKTSFLITHNTILYTRKKRQIIKGIFDYVTHTS
jgi:alcohol dehydrogenase YqhD (iron-dependent ADH family)